jgi:hypothetical protein
MQHSISQCEYNSMHLFIHPNICFQFVTYMTAPTVSAVINVFWGHRHALTLSETPGVEFTFSRDLPKCHQQDNNCHYYQHMVKVPGASYSGTQRVATAGMRPFHLGDLWDGLGSADLPPLDPVAFSPNLSTVLITSSRSTCFYLSLVTRVLTPHGHGQCPSLWDLSVWYKAWLQQHLIDWLNEWMSNPYS